MKHNLSTLCSAFLNNFIFIKLLRPQISIMYCLECNLMNWFMWLKCITNNEAIIYTEFD